MTKTNPELTEGEWMIIRAVWECEPCAAPTVQEALVAEKGWSYSTVKTMMDRMVKKGFLETERMRNLILYRSSITKSQAQGVEIMRAVKRAFNGALPPVMEFLLGNSELTESELNELEELIRKRRDEGSQS